MSRRKVEINRKHASLEELKDIVDNVDNDTVVLYEDEAIITDEPTTTGK